MPPGERREKVGKGPQPRGPVAPRAVPPSCTAASRLQAIAARFAARLAALDGRNGFLAGGEGGSHRCGLGRSSLVAALQVEAAHHLPSQLPFLLLLLFDKRGKDVADRIRAAAIGAILQDGQELFVKIEP